MPESWVDDALGGPGTIPDRFDRRLRADLSAMWTEDGELVAVVPVDGGDGRRASRRRSRSRAGLVAAAAIAAVAAGVLVTRGRLTTETETETPFTAPMASAPLVTSNGPPDPAAPVGVADLAGVTWAVTSIDGESPRGRLPWVRFGVDGRIEGYDGCNWYSVEYELADSALAFVDEIGSTAMLCRSDPVTTIAPGAIVLDDGLQMRGATSGRRGSLVGVRMVATAIERLPATPESVVGRYVIEDTGRVVTFNEDGTLTGVDETCVGSIRWRVDDGLAVEPAGPMSRNPCPRADVSGRGGVTPQGVLLLWDTVVDEPDRVVELVPYDVWNARNDPVSALRLPEDGPAPIEPDVFATVPSDVDPAAAPLIAVFPDELLVLRELRFTAAESGALVGYSYDRTSGEKIFEMVIEGVSERPLRAFGSADGVLYLQLERCMYGAFVQRSGAYRLTDQWSSDQCRHGLLGELVRAVPGGLEVDGSVVLASPRPPVEQEHVTLEDLGRFPPGRVLRIGRQDALGHEWVAWLIEVNTESDAQPPARVSHLAVSPRGATLIIEDGSLEPTLIVLDRAGLSRSYVLGDWAIAGIDERGAVFWRQTDDDRGIELARLPS